MPKGLATPKGNVGASGTPNVPTVAVNAYLNEVDTRTNNNITIQIDGLTSELGTNGAVRGSATSSPTGVASTSALDSVSTKAEATTQIQDKFEALRSGFNGDLTVSGKAASTLSGVNTTSGTPSVNLKIDVNQVITTLLAQTRSGSMTATGVIFDYSPYAANYSKARTITILPWQSTGSTSNTVFIQQENFTVTIEPYYSAYPKTVFILN